MTGTQQAPLMLDVGNRTVRITNPGKLMFPDAGLTKRDLVAYCLSVADGLLRALYERPTTLHRFPDGLGGEAFFAKRVPKGAPDWIETARITFPSGRTADEICPTEAAVLAWAANLGTIEFHPWPVRRSDVDHPDELRIDLDPQPGTGFKDACAVAGEARALLSECGLTCYPKTSGGRGLHLLARIEPRWTFVEARRAVIAFARELERRVPRLVTTSWWKEDRGERVFVDFNQMARDRTVVAAYSVRARPRATVSAPLRWEELGDAMPEDFTMATMTARFAEVGDLLAPMDTAAHRLDTLLEMCARDERERGLGDMPYPPEYPKMPGEPPRVQPSRARPATSANKPG
jgi:DNA ligase D-like protein (predicted polymerase)